jgi:hypothetical protein
VLQAYTIVWMKADDTEHFLIRFDNASVEYIARVVWSYSATFDRRNGDFFSLDNIQGSSREPQLYRYSNTHDLPGYADEDNQDIPQWQDQPAVYNALDCNGVLPCDGGG